MQTIRALKSSARPLVTSALVSFIETEIGEEIYADILASKSDISAPPEQNGYREPSRGPSPEGSCL